METSKHQLLSKIAASYSISFNQNFRALFPENVITQCITNKKI